MRTCLLTALLVAAAMPAISSSAKPVDYAPDSWVLVGPFDNSHADGRRTGLDVDYLKGEAGARDLKGKKVKGRVIDLAAAFSPSDDKVAYALGVIKSDKAQRVTALFGSDDGAKVWVNDKVVHRMEADRALAPEQDRFEIDLREGDNSILVKVENGSGGWGFSLSIPTPEEAKRRAAAAFQRGLGVVEIVPGPQEGYGRILAGEAFPSLEFKDSLLLEPYIKTDSLTTRWFNSEAQEVKEASKPGLYFAWAEYETKSGRKVNAMPMFYRAAPELFAGLNDPIFVERIVSMSPECPIPSLAENWPSAGSLLKMMSTRQYMESLFTSDTGPVFLSLLNGLKPAGASPQALPALIGDMAVKVKSAALGTSSKTLAEPALTADRAPELRMGTESEAGVKPGTAEKLKAILAEWSQAEGKPFSAVIARHGVAFLHEGFGGVQKDAGFYPASIGKTLFGLVFAQFVDQGLVNPDQPIGDYLRGFPTKGPKAITFRECVTHTSGIADHGTYGGWRNPTLDSAFSLWTDSIEPGRRFAYGGDGNNLASKALELISGLSISHLMDRQLFEPLGTSISQPDGGWSDVATAWDIAKVGQLIANRGRYGSRVFLSEEGFKKFLPVRVKDYVKTLGDPSLEWGFAVSYMMDPDGPRSGGVLGPNVIGHGSASSSILRIDLDSGVVVVMGRYGLGKTEAYNEGRVRLMKAIKEALVN